MFCNGKMEGMSPAESDAWIKSATVHELKHVNDEDMTCPGRSSIPGTDLFNPAYDCWSASMDPKSCAESFGYAGQWKYLDTYCETYDCSDIDIDGLKQTVCDLAGYWGASPSGCFK